MKLASQKETPAQKQAREKLIAESLRKSDTPRSFTSLTSPLNTRSLPGVRIHPTGSRVLLEYEEIADVSAGGILIPSTAQTRKSNGSYPAKILAVGPGRFSRKNIFLRLPMVCKPGDRVMAPALNFPLFMDGREVYLTDEAQIFGMSLGPEDEMELVYFESQGALR